MPLWYADMTMSLEFVRWSWEKRLPSTPRKTRMSTPVDLSHLLQSIHRDGLHRARPEIPPDPHAFPVLAIRNKNAHAPASVRCFPLSFQLDFAPRLEDEQPPHEQSWYDQGRCLWSCETIWGSSRRRRDDTAR